jgi:hypothetical protein
VPAGYDLTPLPIHVPPRDGEAVVSWLRRVSLRYDVPVRDLLKGAGTSKPITGTSKVVTRLRNNRVLLDRLSLTAAEAKQLLAPPAMLAALDDYLRTLRRQWAPPPRWSRYCPACLSDADSFWDSAWQSPLSLVCLRHGIFLLNTCPGCGEHPLASPVWMSKPLELWRCPSRVHRSRSGARTVHPWCGADLRDAPNQPADRDLHDAQRLLAGWSVGPSEPATACGLRITHRIGFHAFVDLVDAALDGRANDILQLENQPRQSADGFLSAAEVLTRTTLDGASLAASRLLSYDGPHAPIRPGPLIEAHPYSPLLAALQLHGVRDQLSPTDQLTFRLSQPVGRFPATLTADLRSRLRLPEHRLLRPERDDRWFPQCLWPGAMPDTGGDLEASPLHRACLAMTFAKLGSGSGWADIANTLSLPAAIPTNIDAVLQSWVRSGSWPTLLGTLDALLGQLQVLPPPIDYQQRREIGRDTNLLDHALDATSSTHPSPLPHPQLRRVLWETFTGGDIAYAPEPLTLNAKSHEYEQFRRAAHDSTDRDLPRLQTANQQIEREVGFPLGPLMWTPRQPRRIPTETDAASIIIDTSPSRRTWDGFSPF